MSIYYPAMEPEIVEQAHNVGVRVNTPELLGCVIEGGLHYGSTMSLNGRHVMWLFGGNRIRLWSSDTGYQWKACAFYDWTRYKHEGTGGGTVFRKADGGYGLLFHRKGIGLCLAEAERWDCEGWVETQAPVLRATSDTNNVCFWDETKGYYVLYLRAWRHQGEKIERVVVRTTCEDFHELMVIEPRTAPNDPSVKPWPLNDELPIVMASPFPDVQIYNPAVTRWEDWYLAFPGMLRRVATPDGEVEIMDIGFAWSRDGIAWTIAREPYVRLGMPEGSESGASIAYTNLINTGKQLLLAYYSWNCTHAGKCLGPEAWRREGGVHLAAQEPGRFVGYEFGTAGQLRVGPILCAGPRLIVDADISAMGWLTVRVDMMITSGTYDEENCRKLFGNRQNHKVTWRESPADYPLKDCQGYHVVLTFFGERCKLFSFGFEE